MKKCLYCNKEIIKKKLESNKNFRKKKYCNSQCYGKGYIFKPNKGSFKKGQHPSPKTEFKKGHPAPKTAFKKGQSREKSLQWKGGTTNNNGYIMVLLSTHPFCDRQGRVRRSRLVIEKHLGRYLKPKEVVHHINSIRDDDRLENLILFSNNNKHLKFHWEQKKSVQENFELAPI